jgi:hypothetical protein
MSGGGADGPWSAIVARRSATQIVATTTRTLVNWPFRVLMRTPSADPRLLQHLPTRHVSIRRLVAVQQRCPRAGCASNIPRPDLPAGITRTETLFGARVPPSPWTVAWAPRRIRAMTVVRWARAPCACAIPCSSSGIRGRDPKVEPNESINLTLGKRRDGEQLDGSRQSRKVKARARVCEREGSPRPYRRDHSCRARTRAYTARFS